MSVGDERLHKQVILDWLNRMASDHPKMTAEGVVACFQDEFDYWPEELEADQHRGSIRARAVGPYRRDGGATQRQAAYDNYPRSGTQRYKVLWAIAKNDGLTRDEIAAMLGLPDSSVDARVWELKKGNWIYETGFTRKTSNGSEAVVLNIYEHMKVQMARSEGIHQ